jgi:hypothetical protein
VETLLLGLTTATVSQPARCDCQTKGTWKLTIPRKTTPGDLSTATPEQRRQVFAAEYVSNGGRAGPAAAKAGFAHPAQRGAELLREERTLEMINQALTAQLAKDGVAALAQIKAISKTGKAADNVRLNAAKLLVQVSTAQQKVKAELEERRRAKEELPKTRNELVAELAEYLVRLQDIAKNNPTNPALTIPLTIQDFRGRAVVEPVAAPEKEPEPAWRTESIMWRGRHKGGGRKKAAPEPTEVELEDDTELPDLTDE